VPYYEQKSKRKEQKRRKANRKKILIDVVENARQNDLARLNYKMLTSENRKKNKGGDSSALTMRSSILTVRKK
jgi:hypothetical protein